MTSVDNINYSIHDFIVKEDRFEGPFIKILELVESHKLSISEITLSKIADDYIAYVKSLENKNVYDMSQFILVASTLMLIKAKALLPKFTYTDEEEKQVIDLEKKLKLYEELVSAMKNIDEIFSKNKLRTRERTHLDKDRVITLSSYSLELFNVKNILSIALLTLAKLPNYERLKNVAVRQNIRLEHVIENILSRITSSFESLKGMAKTLTSNQKDIKKNIIVSFLAILELVKSNQIVAEESDGDIRIRKAK